MEVEEGQREIALPAAQERPQTARRDSHSRTIPGGFDSLDDLSPSKEELGHSIIEDSKAHNAKAHGSNNQAPSLDYATLPSLPPPGDSSLLYSQSEHAGMGSDALQDTVDEGAMQRHLNDVESSFMPVPSPISMDGKKGVDDSYLFDAAQAPPRDQRRSADMAMTPTKPSPETQAPDTPISPPTPADAYKTPGVSRDDTTSFDESIDAGNTTSSLETLSSSPTAAAAARTVSRAISLADVGGKTPSSTVGERSSQQETYIVNDTNSTPKKNKKRKKEEEGSVSADSDDRSTLRDDPSNRSIDSSFGDAGHVGNTPGLALLHRKSSGRRPRFLRSRHASQNSSVSSFITNEESQDGSEITVGADYALQSGGAVPADGFSRNSSMGLSRTISLGSMASGIEEFSGNGPDGSLATLTEEEHNRDRISEGSPPATPRAPIPRSSIAAPSDTVIARHVRNVQVPASVAQEYRNKNGVSPKRSGFSVSTLGRNSKNLTLKEQSSTIERLSKENFDLKLKVMFLSDRLDKLSEEGVKEMISENVELKTGLAVIQRDNKALKRKIRELEKLQKDDEERPSTAGTLRGDPSPQWSEQEGAQEREEELLYLRERIEEYVTEIEKMRNDAMVRENDKRNLAEVVRQMGERRGQNVEAREEMDVWKDLLEQETSRREQADDENRKLREEIFRLKTETTTGVPGLNHTTNIYNITKKRNVSPSRPRSGMSEYPDERSGTVSSATTLVDDLKRESDQLRHENAELRREVGAQTSMLTSRNREKERLYQEIEDLKLGQRRNGGGSVTGDSILERSASRAHERSSSRTSVGTRQKNVDDNEREDFENKHAELRDRINSLKIQNQDLQRELESCMKDFETAVEQKKEVELEANELQEALEMAESDVVAMQAERDDALRGQEETEIDFENLRKEAQAELDHYQLEVETATSEIGRLQSELADTTENFNELQNQMRVMSESMLRLEDGHESKGRRIEELERELEEVNREQEQMENNLVEANGKINRLGVQQESSQNEIAFLREEQDGDKIKIGDLEAALKNSKDAVHDERERVKELEDLISAERHQREVVAGKEKQEVQQFINELNRECSNAKDEARRLRKSLSSQEVEAAEWKQRLMELESNLREALGDLNGTRSSLLHSIENLQRELERTMRDLDITKATLQEKERNLKIRDDLLESNSLETRKLADIVDKERQAHRLTKHQFETFQKTQQHNTRTLTQQELRVLELETSRHQDRQKILRLENNFKDQMLERNQLLLALWNRLSAICGSDWTHNNSLINGRALPSLEAVSTMLPGFSKNLVAAVKTIENLVGDFRSRIRAVEKDLWKEYQTLETNLELRTKRLDRLETVARSGIPSTDVSSSSEISKLKAINRALQHEIASLRTAHDVRSNTVDDPSPSPSVPTGPRNISSDKSRTSTLTRHNTTSTIETIGRVASGRGSTSTGDKSIASSIKEDEHKQPDMRWQIRLRELEFKLMSEREGRLLDRGSMKERVSELTEEKEELLAQLEREKMRSALGR